MESIKVTSLDLGNISDADLVNTSNTYIREPGRYTVAITGYKMGMKKSPDGAGKAWGWLRINLADTTTGHLASAFIDVPVDSLVFTSNAGKTSNIKAQIMKNFLTAIGVENVSVNNLAGHINNLSTLLDAKPILTVSLGYNQDHVAYRGKDDAGNNIYGIELAGGGALLDENGAEVTRGSFDEIKAYYKGFKGFDPQTNMVAKSFAKA